jgi:hypothetical protein
VHQISVQNGQDVDDLASIVATAPAIMVSYTPRCMDGVCTCGGVILYTDVLMTGAASPG